MAEKCAESVALVNIGAYREEGNEYRYCKAA